mmetsp:Transcript_31213/g.47796  ORF Transcript_31213/g.47796 Transcript_31213/m.47796 type:complete len:135 (-) Transcript_31213:2998-3402(-)
MNWVDVPMEKQQISLSRHRYVNGGTTMARSNEQIVVQSGECNFKFKFRLVSLERISKIFEEIQNPVATDNKETEPRNVTLNHEKVINRNGSSKQKGKGLEVDLEDEEAGPQKKRFSFLSKGKSHGTKSSHLNED